MSVGELTCDHCGSRDITVDVKPVRPHGDRLVAECLDCHTAWVNTYPSVVEKLVVARHSQG
jgi:uncharacterized Zn finger protein